MCSFCAAIPNQKYQLKVKSMDYNNNNNPYTQQNNNYYSNGQGQPVRNPGQTMATMAMVLGLASIFTMFTIYIPLICGSLAVVFAILSKGYGKKMLAAAKIGIGTAIAGIALIVTILGSVSAMLLSLSSEDLVNLGRELDQQFESQTGRELEEVLGTSYEEIMKEYTGTYTD